MRRLIGSLLVLHGFAHAGAGIWATPGAPHLLVTLLWWVAMVGFVSAGAGLIGVRWLDRRGRPLAVIAALASLALLTFYPHPVLLIGAAIDGMILIDSIPFAHRVITRDLGLMLHPPRRHLGKVGTGVVVAILVYVSAVVLTRPWNATWGVSDGELMAPLPGDELNGSGRYLVQHGVTIHAPADSVWPWLAQIGADKGGFYSHAWLERAFGDPIHNADRIVPEWQSIKAGDLVRSAPPNYLAGMLGRDPGWRVTAAERGRLLVLDGWGAFVLQAVNDTTTRLYVRTRGDAEPTLASVTIAPLGLLVFEPAHFIMQRSMLLGIRDRAEQARRGR